MRILGSGGCRFVFTIVISFGAVFLPLEASGQLASNALPAEVLTDQQWDEVNRSVDRALDWLAANQQPDGSFKTQPHGQPGVTSLCIMSYLAQGHLPGEGKYGAVVAKGLNYIAACQKRNGIIAVAAPNGEKISRLWPHTTGWTVSYNHAISGLVLSESYAMSGAANTKAIQPVIQKALDVTFIMQDWPNDQPKDEGGWRYLDDYEHIDSDLSITGWQLMFLRSAKNAGFDIEEQRIDRAVEYVKRCFLKKTGTFTYKLEPADRSSRGMAGAGILALAHSGLHNTPEAQRAGDWLLKSGFQRYNRPGRVTGSKPSDDRYHYGLLTCSHAMYQLGGRHWQGFFPEAVKVVLSSQNRNGSWDAENHDLDRPFGNAYTTAICVLALSASNELMPIFQR